MTALIFGANGQDGFYLSQLLKKQGCEVLGISRSGDFLRADISDYASVKALIEQQKPDYIFHLAANSVTKHETVFENYETITTGTLNILEAVKNVSPQTRVFISGSGLQFRNEGRPIKESDAFEARDIYSVCRIQSVYAARYYRGLGLKVYVGYFFNHDSPLRTERHMSRKIVEAAKRIAAGSIEKLIIGDIKIVKEWTFAGDIAKAILTLVDQDEVSEAIIGSGKGHTIEDWLQLCFSLVKMNWKEHVVKGKDFVSDYRQLVSDPSLIFSLGWTPETSFEDLSRMMMKH